MTTSGTARAGAAGLVVLQLLLLAALVFEPHGALWPRGIPALVVSGVLLAAGLVIAIWGVIGLGPALTASPIPKDRAPLVTNGLYALVRNPIYTGLMIIGAGLVVIGASWWHAATWAALLVLLAAKARWEERMLGTQHPDFAAYAAHVGRFIPGVGRWRVTQGRENSSG